MSEKDIPETMKDKNYYSFIENFQHNIKQAEIDYIESLTKAVPEQKYINSIITRIKKYCRDDLKNDPEKKRSYLENCINDKYSEQIKLRIYLLIKYQYDKTTTLLLKYKISSIREKKEIYHENLTEINKIMNILLKNEKTLFNICRKDIKLMGIVFSDDPWTIFIEELIQYYDDIEIFELNRNPENKPKQNIKIQLSKKDFLKKLFDVFEEIGFARNNTSDSLKEYKYEFTGRVTTAHYIWSRYHDYHNLKQKDFFSNYMRINKNRRAVPLKGHTMGSHGVSKKTDGVLSAEQKEILDNFFKNKFITA